MLTISQVVFLNRTFQLHLSTPCCLRIQHGLSNNCLHEMSTVTPQTFTMLVPAVTGNIFVADQTFKIKSSTSPVSIDIMKTTPIREVCPIFCQVPSTLTATSATHNHQISL